MTEAVQSEDLEPHQVEARKRARLREEQEAADWSWLLDSPRGRRIVWGILEQNGVYHTTFTGDALSSAFNEGQRNAALKVLMRVQTIPGALALMTNEARA